MAARGVFVSHVSLLPGVARMDLTRLGLARRVVPSSCTFSSHAWNTQLMSCRVCYMLPGVTRTSACWPPPTCTRPLPRGSESETRHCPTRPPQPSDIMLQIARQGACTQQYALETKVLPRLCAAEPLHYRRPPLDFRPPTSERTPLRAQGI